MRPVMRALLVAHGTALQPVAIAEFGNEAAGLVAQRRHFAAAEQALIAGNTQQHVVETFAETQFAVGLAGSGDDGLGLIEVGKRIGEGKTAKARTHKHEHRKHQSTADGHRSPHQAPHRVAWPGGTVALAFPTANRREPCGIDAPKGGA